MNRRDFLRGATCLAAATKFGRPDETGARALPWPVGCFNRPWTRWSFDDALAGIKAAGFTVMGLLTRTPEEPFIATDASPEYLDRLRQRIASHGLTANMGALRLRNDLSAGEAIRDTRRQVDNAATMSLQYLLSFGVEKPDQYDTYYRAMADAAAYAQERGIKLVEKPHGGSSGSSEEILAAIKRVGHPNFRIWYDAGNIIHYTGKDPVAELAPIVQHVSGFCAKDCGELKGEVMIQFGTGKVDFRAVFEKLHVAGFQGPVMIECCAQSDSRERVTENARANRMYLERILAGMP